MGTYKPSEAMKRHLKRVEADPGKAMELSPALRRELDGMTEADLGQMAQSVKFSRGQPIHLTDEQNREFVAANKHLPTFSKKAETFKAPPGKFAGADAQGGGGGAMSDAWAKFGGSVEDFKAEVFKAVPADLRVGRQEWLVQGVVYGKDGKVAILNGGCFQDSEKAEAHARRLQDHTPWFDFHVVSKWSWVPYPMTEDTARGVQRTYKDDNLNAIMREHFDTSTSVRQRQLEEAREVEERRGAREGGPDGEFPPTEVQVNQIDDGAGDNEIKEREAAAS